MAATVPVICRKGETALTSEEGRRLGAGAGVFFAPGVLLDGEPFSYGRLSERRLRHALTAATTTGPTP